MGFVSEYKQVNRLLQQKPEVVFYAESRHYYQYFERLINDLLAKNVKICYITSDGGDPLLSTAPPGMQVIYVKWMLGFLFSRIKADVVIMTMPDLGNYLFKRSALVGKYIYMFHAAVSTHQQYRKEAFFNYDTIFCTGDYQQKEIRRSEELYVQKRKEIIPYGYSLLDQIKKEKSLLTKPMILVAPSWFEGCIFDTCIEELLQQLSRLPYDIIIRSHPEYEKRKKKSFQKIKQMQVKQPCMRIDNEPDVMKKLGEADILITDRSGIAFEFALGAGKPVLFIETILKQINPDWKELGIDPIENGIRSELGVSVSPEKLEQLPQKVDELKQMTIEFSSKMKELKTGLFYNSDESYKAGLEYVMQNISR